MERGNEIQTEKRNKIVNIAYGLFIKKGLEKTSIRDIASLADVNVNTLYYYFRTKAEIVICCVEYGLGKISKDIFETIDLGGAKKNRDLKSLLNYSLKYREELCWCYQVITSPNYNWLVKDILIKVRKGYCSYIDEMANQICCDKELFMQLAMITIQIIKDFMITEDENCFSQIELINERLQALMLTNKKIFRR